MDVTPGRGEPRTLVYCLCALMSITLCSMMCVTLCVIMCLMIPSFDDVSVSLTSMNVLKANLVIKWLSCILGQM